MLLLAIGDQKEIIGKYGNLVRKNGCSLSYNYGRFADAWLLRAGLQLEIESVLDFRHSHFGYFGNREDERIDQAKGEAQSTVVGRDETRAPARGLTFS
jgi:hypothetical protein